jgi:hypothetical protein
MIRISGPYCIRNVNAAGGEVPAGRVAGGVACAAR